MSKMISSWETHSKGYWVPVEEALNAGEISKNETVWTGGDGSIYIGPCVDLEEDDSVEYWDRGTVREYLSE